MTSVSSCHADNCTEENNLLFMPQCVIIKSVEAGGGLAQLGERLHGMQEVTSSSLVSSTIFIGQVFQ